MAQATAGASSSSPRSASSIASQPVPSEPDLSTKVFAKFHAQSLGWLGFAGLPGNYHTLNQLFTYRREIVPVEDIGLHLLWKQSPIPTHFIKPLPRTLVTDEFNLAVQNLDKLNAGFLYSYTRLIESELDLQLALKLGLVDDRFKGGWSKWSRFAKNFKNDRDADEILKTCDPRFTYGDLRLNRLNMIMWMLHWGDGFYHTRDPVRSFWSGYGKYVIIVFAYVTTTLTAMQVALAVTTNPAWLTQTFKWFSYVILILIACQVPFVVLVFLLRGLSQAIGWIRKKAVKPNKVESRSVKTASPA